MNSVLSRLATRDPLEGEQEDAFGGASSSSANLAHPANSFSLAAGPDPFNFASNYIDVDSSSPQKPIKINHGTTTLAMRYRGGIVVCVDSRATAGSYIASGTVKKVIVVAPHILGTIAGGAADCQYWLGYLSSQCRLYELRNKEPISVAAASKMLANLVYSYKGGGLSIGSMLAGVDKTGFALHYVDSDGSRLKGDYFSVGSGSTFAYGVLDAGYRWDMEDEEAYDLARRSIFAAAHRDSYSGNTINTYHIKESGWEFLGRDDFMDLWEHGVSTGPYAGQPYGYDRAKVPSSTMPIPSAGSQAPVAELSAST